MSTKLNDIFNFLNTNRKYNYLIQNRNYQNIFCGKNNDKEGLIALLYQVSSTQTQPKIDLLAQFFSKVHEEENSFNSFQSFVTFVNPNYSVPNFKNLFDGLKSQPGWGEKTSALFVKSIFQLHHCDYSKEFKIWNDVPKLIGEDKLYLPVDSVIKTIFNKMGYPSTFNSINALLNKSFNSEKIEVWDDLWFWGFVSQRVSGNKRILEWNKNKYWMMQYSEKDNDTINEIKSKMEIFIKLIQNKGIANPNELSV
jgi:hypothetical protein